MMSSVLKYLSLTFVFTIIISIEAAAKTQLWTKTIENVGPYSYWNIGSDGTVAIIQQKPNLDHAGFRQLEKIHWIGRDGNEISSVPTNFVKIWNAAYVTKEQIVLVIDDDDETVPSGMSKVEIFYINADDILEKSLIIGEAGDWRRNSIKYPYLLDLTIIEENGNGSHDYQFTLYNLIHENSIKVVGDAVIGVHGKNLKVRWKTVAGAKYKVQSSIDLENWTDYTEIIDGNGSTMVINIPLDEFSDKVFARVVLL